MTTSVNPNLSSTVELKPSYNIPIVLVIGAIPLFFLQPLIGGILALFGLFLLFQTVTLSLQFK